MKDSLIIQLLEKIELFLYRKARLIISVTHSFKHILVSRGIAGEKIKVITNGVDASRFFQLEKDADLVTRYHLEGQFVAGYVGTHGLAHHLETILEAAAIAQTNNDNIKFILLGNGARKAELIKLAGQMELKNVIFIDSVPKAEVPRYWSLLDVSIIHLKKMELFTSVIPSKLFECMAMGLPVLHGVAGESADIVNDNKVGMVFEPEDAQALYQHLVELKNNPKLYADFQSRCLVAAHKYDRTNLGKEFLVLLTDIKNGIYC
jgi:hypothetical protein